MTDDLSRRDLERARMRSGLPPIVPDAKDCVVVDADGYLISGRLLTEPEAKMCVEAWTDDPKRYRRPFVVQRLAARPSGVTEGDVPSKDAIRAALNDVRYAAQLSDERLLNAIQKNTAALAAGAQQEKP